MVSIFVGNYREAKGTESGREQIEDFRQREHGEWQQRGKDVRNEAVRRQSNEQRRQSEVCELRRQKRIVREYR